MLGRRKQETSIAELTEEAARPERPGAKGRPTPRRKDQEAARKRPLVPATTAKGKKAADRAARRESARRTREAMVTGDEKNLPERDKGPVRRHARDVVDARINPGEFLLPIMLAVLVLSFFPTRLATYAFLIIYGLLLVSVLDVVLLARRVRRQVTERFGSSASTRGLGMYIAMRAFQMRRTRLPKPAVARGEAPR